MKNLSIKIFAIITLLTIAVFSQNTSPVVSDVDFSITGTTVTVTYNVSDAHQGTVIIRMLVSSNNGATWDYNYGGATGAIGSGVTTGTGKSITWTYSGEPNNNFKIRIIADDNTAEGSTCPGVETVTYSGKTYNTVQIGNQCWLRENLDVGSMINGTTSGYQQTNNGTIEKYCYDNNSTNCNMYGGLYEWPEAMQYVTTEGARGICPEGWHIPAYAEFQTLSTVVGNNSNTLKALGQGTGSGQGTNTSGFTALLAGRRYSNGGFYDLGSYAYFWSSTEYSSSHANTLYLNNNDSNIYLYRFTKEHGFSVRCVKD